MSLDHRPASLAFPAPPSTHHLVPSSRSPRLPSSPVLLQPLPPANTLHRESLAQSELELDRQTRQLQRERELADALQEQQWEIQRLSARKEIGSDFVRRAAGSEEHGKGKGKGNDGESKPFSRPPQAYELYQAIDKHDIDFIMRVRDHAFGLLLAKNAGEFPIVYAARIGDSHRDIVILLIGALSRYVNQLEEDDFAKKETRNTLKALRSNLKLAIDNALLPSHSTHLLSSYLQVLIMSEGDSWLHKATYDVSLLVRAPGERPVASAEEMVRRFCTKELRGVGVGGVEEYIANAALDLVIMAVWSVAAQQMQVDALPTHTFARDTRTWQMLKEATEEHRGKLHKISPRIRRLVDVLLDRAGDSKKSIPGRLRDVQEVLDGGS